MSLRTVPVLVPLLLALQAAAPRTVLAPERRPARPDAGTLGGPRTVLAGDAAERFERGRALFERDFHRSQGLGAPEMNADSCRACHQDPVVGGAGALELNVSRFARDHGGLGPFEDLPGGQVLARLRPPWSPAREEYAAAEADVFEQRQTPALFGLGLIELVPEAAILANADPLDLDGDGIRGVARWLHLDGPAELGRFGWKAQVPSLLDFVHDALGNELGLTSADGARGFALETDADAVPDPELDHGEVEDLAFFLAQLAPPQRAGSLAPEVLAGELLFQRLACARCHVPELPSPAGPVRLFSDLLLHQVWPAGFRGMGEPDAPPGVYRTPPLWGVRATAPYLHDGRASSLRAAILLHDGEALASRRAFERLPEPDKQALLAFLEDL
jgi:CxxC motif-containing protein (DUF1111 family)